jgi:beta-phosphoglucomutase-like phosphatase (HAD superfamily)
MSHAGLLRLLSNRAGWVSLDPMAGKGSSVTPWATRNINKGAKLQCVLFDFEVLSASDHDPEKEKVAAAKYYQKTGLDYTAGVRRTESVVLSRNAALLTTKELREQLLDKGLATTGKPWDLRSRLSAAWQEASDPVSVQEDTGPKDANDIRLKYASKMRDIKNKQMSKKPRQVDGSTFGKVSEEDSDKVWGMKKGATMILSYLSGRGIRIGLVLKPDTTDFEVERFADNMQKSIKFAAVVRPERNSLVPTAAHFRETANLMGIAPKEMLVVTDKAQIMASANEAQSFCCFFETKNARRPQRHPDFSASALLDVQLAVEELNGVSFR